MHKFIYNVCIFINIFILLFFPLTTLGASNQSMQSSMSQQSMSNCMQMMANDLGSKGPDYDKHFIDLMIAHHQGAIAMAKDALKNANHPELYNLAKNIISAQTKEIEKMKKWRKSWYGS